MTKILLAEDDNDMRRFLVKALQNAGYDVASFDNGLSAYNRLREEPFELLLTDIVMPEMDGIELARRATDAAIAEFEARRAELEKVAQAKLDAAKALGEQLAGKSVRIAQKAGVDGRLFGSVTNQDIADALTKLGLAVAKAQVRLPNGPLKTVGEHTVSVAPHTDVVVDVSVQVVAQAD